MDRLPIFLRLTDKPCLVVGGGIVAERKVRLLLRSGASIAVLAPTVSEALQKQIDDGLITYFPQRYSSEFVRDYWLVIAATDEEALNHRIAADADTAGRFCNVVDDNAASTFILPAIVDRSPVVPFRILPIGM